jgi:hypothetical protein
MSDRKRDASEAAWRASPGGSLAGSAVPPPDSVIQNCLEVPPVGPRHEARLLVARAHVVGVRREARQARPRRGVGLQRGEEPARVGVVVGMLGGDDRDPFQAAPVEFGAQRPDGGDHRLGREPGRLVGDARRVDADAVLVAQPGDEVGDEGGVVADLRRPDGRVASWPALRACTAARARAPAAGSSRRWPARRQEAGREVGVHEGRHVARPGRGAYSAGFHHSRRVLMRSSPKVSRASRARRAGDSLP